MANVKEGIGQSIFGAILGFAITYGVIYWINKRKSITPEQKAKIQQEKTQKLKQKQQLKQEKAQVKLELQKAKLKEKELEVQRKTLKREERKKAKAESVKVKEYATPPSQPVQSQPSLVCPHCGSTNIQPLGQHKKGFSVGKAVGGTILTGGVGALAGFAGKKTKQTDFVCMNCGKQFKR
ncbi:hypothetical protein [Limosilactobacillus albertensis]|uniref:hypothetical protein n=1 Tax=Limosilactobacillus albertensis TaxID=2759752 RepID=UPI001E340361|nr:hypothetical protein [Limosilactobacillus albertensis]